MSGRTDAETIQASRAAGAVVFLPKPVPLDRLIKTCQALAVIKPQ
jgi:DNA-binding NarL/FixJ family response regulator